MAVKTQRLRGQLQVIAGGDVGGFVVVAVFGFDRVRRAARAELHHIGRADQAQGVMPQRQGTLTAHATDGSHASDSARCQASA